MIDYFTIIGLLAFNDNTVYTGKIPDWNKFDHSFFGVHTRLVRNADPMMGLMLERTFEAIVDAGKPYSYFVATEALLHLINV